MTPRSPIADDGLHAPAEVVSAADLLGDVRREVLARQLRDRHRWMLQLSLCILAASFLLRTSEAGTVGVRWLNLSLPPLCGSKIWFDVECPGCGLTRSFLALAAGDVQESYRCHRLGWLMALCVVAQVPYRLFALRELRANIVAKRAWAVWFGYALIAVLLLNWLLKQAALW